MIGDCQLPIGSQRYDGSGNARRNAIQVKTNLATLSKLHLGLKKILGFTELRSLQLPYCTSARDH